MKCELIFQGYEKYEYFSFISTQLKKVPLYLLFLSQTL